MQLNEPVLLKQQHWARPDHALEEEGQPEM